MRLLLAVTLLLAGCAARPPAQGFQEPQLEQVRLQIQAGPPAELSAGAARVEITPPVGTPLAGYAKRHGRPSTGIRDPLYVRALALSDGKDRVVLISSDLLVFPPPVAERILRRVMEQHSLPPQAIILAATHTHSGAGAIGHGFLYEQVFGSYQDEYVEGITGRVSWAVGQALAGLRPAQGTLVRGDRLLEGYVENRMSSLGPVDASVRVLLLASAEGKPLAMLVQAAAHPTLMEWGDMRFSADFPGEVSRLMEAAYPGVVCLFANGAAGNARPRDAIGANPEERVARFGALVAEGAQGLISRASLKPRADLACWGMAVRLPEVQMRFGPVPVPTHLGRLMRPTTSFLSVVSVGDALLVPVSGELTAELGMELGRRIRERGKAPLIIGYAGGYLGYAVTPEQYEAGSYESWMTWYGKEFGTFLVENLDRLAALSPKEGD